MKPFYSAIILMGGEGKRALSSIPKQFLMLGHDRVYQHTLNTFYDSKLFDEIILVCHEQWLLTVAKETAHLQNVKVTSGGLTRQESSFQGLKQCHPSCHYVVIHDGARPFVSKHILQDHIHLVARYEAVDTCIPSADTLITTHDGLFIQDIPSRKLFRRGQTPQSFAYGVIQNAHAQTKQINATDDCQLVLEQGVKIAISEGEEKNFKITTNEDLEFARWKLFQQGEKENET